MKEVVEDVIEPMDVRRKLRTPTKKLSIPSPPDEDERTTASIGSISSDKNTFDMDMEDTYSSGAFRNHQDGSTTGTIRAALVEQQPQENGRVKRFINDIRNKGKSMSCKSSTNIIDDDTVIGEERHNMMPLKVNQINDDGGNGNELAPADKTSKVCNIL